MIANSNERRLRTLQKTIAIVAMAIEAVSCAAQSERVGPIQAIHEPIEMSYSELDTAKGTGEFEVTFFKDGQKIRNIEQKFDGTVSAQVVGDGLLEISIANRMGASITDSSYSNFDAQVICLMSKVGELVECEPPTRINYPVYERPGYKSGDKLQIPLGQINDADLAVTGTVKGRATIGERSVLAVDFVEGRSERMGPARVRFEVSGHAYLDLITGHPVRMDITANASGPFQGYDRMLIYLRQDLMIPTGE